MAQFFLLKINTALLTYLIPEGELKLKNHLLIFLHVPMTSDISELQYSTVYYNEKTNDL